jgi:hypothetical protein
LFCVNKVRVLRRVTRVTCCCCSFVWNVVVSLNVCRHTPPDKMCSPLAQFFSPPRPLTHFPGNHGPSAAERASRRPTLRVPRISENVFPQG